MLHLGSGDLRHCLSVKVNLEATKYGSSLVVSLLILQNCVQYYKFRFVLSDICPCSRQV